MNAKAGADHEMPVDAHARIVLGVGEAQDLVAERSSALSNSAR